MSTQARPLLPVRVARPLPGRFILPGLLTVAAIVLIWLVDPRQFNWTVCAFYRMTGLYCPGCGATRATHDLLHGELVSALRHNALWVLAFPLAVYAVLSEIRRLTRGRPLPWDPVENRWFLVGAITVAVLFGLLRNVPLYPFVFLAPPG